MTLMPRAQEWTVDDLGGLREDDALQYELLDGLLLVTPAPIPLHQRACREIFKLIDSACPQQLETFFAPLDWQPDRGTSLQPDILVVHRQRLDGMRALTAKLVLAVEVLSPSTRRKDLMLKWSKYQDSGVASYWAIDPAVPSISAWILIDGAYREVGHAEADESLTLTEPFPVTVVPSRLV